MILLSEEPSCQDTTMKYMTMRSNDDDNDDGSDSNTYIASQTTL